MSQVDRVNLVLWGLCEPECCSHSVTSVLATYGALLSGWVLGEV